MKTKMLTIAMMAAAALTMACAKNETAGTDTPRGEQRQQDDGKERLDIVWHHLDEHSADTGKSALMDVLWSVYGSNVLIIREPGNPDVGVVPCSSPAAAPIMADIRSIAAATP